MEKESLRYHVRLEAEVKCADLNTMAEQRQPSKSTVQDQQPQPQFPLARNKPVHSRSSRQDLNSVQKELKQLKHDKPHHYIRLMTRIQPKINRPDVLIERLQRVQARDPAAAQDIRNILHKTPVKAGAEPELKMRIRSMKANSPREYIYIIEMLFPEIRPRSVEKYWLKKQARVRGNVTGSRPKAPHRK
jgi:hypothetical protein